jgi:hypothetical protein
MNGKSKFILIMTLQNYFWLFKLIIFSWTAIDSQMPSTSPDVEGTYFIHGTRIEYEYDFPWPQWGGDEVILSSDTSNISFTATIKMSEDKQDTIQFFGLVGASAGEQSAAQIFCEEPSSDCVYARIEGSSFEMFVAPSNQHYTAKGTIQNNLITIEGFFEFRAIGVKYILEGERFIESIDP